jgi:pyridoxine 5-phosphate synthase
MIRLGLNIDHVATIRNARGGAHPDPVEAARIAVAAGADGITAHLREDRRHIRDADIERLRAEIAAPLNMEMAATEEMVAIALRLRPNACCIVPERRAEVTTEGGLDAAGQEMALWPMVAALRDAGIRVSLFIDPDMRQLQAAASLHADIVELHTGAYAGGRPGEIDRLRLAAEATTGLGLECHAGHGLTYGNVGPVAALPEIAELNIGHFLIGQAIFDGLPAVIAQMRRQITRPAGGSRATP